LPDGTAEDIYPERTTELLEGVLGLQKDNFNTRRGATAGRRVKDQDEAQFSGGEGDGGIAGSSRAAHSS